MTTPRRVTAVRIPALRERDVTRVGIDWLRSRGWKMMRLQSGAVRALTGNTFMRLSEAGTPDWVGLREMAGLLVEFKRPGKKPSKVQAGFHADCERRGIPVIWADSLSMLIDKYGKWFVR